VVCLRVEKEGSRGMADEFKADFVKATERINYLSAVIIGYNASVAVLCPHLVDGKEKAPGSVYDAVNDEEK
jgi:hypothetical protein